MCPFQVQLIKHRWRFWRKNGNYKGQGRILFSISLLLLCESPQATWHFNKTLKGTINTSGGIYATAVISSTALKGGPFRSASFCALVGQQCFYSHWKFLFYPATILEWGLSDKHTHKHTHQICVHIKNVNHISLTFDFPFTDHSENRTRWKKTKTKQNHEIDFFVTKKLKNTAMSEQVCVRWRGHAVLTRSGLLEQDAENAVWMECYH